MLANDFIYSSQCPVANSYFVHPLNIKHWQAVGPGIDQVSYRLSAFVL